MGLVIRVRVQGVGLVIRVRVQGVGLVLVSLENPNWLTVGCTRWAKSEYWLKVYILRQVWLHSYCGCAEPCLTIVAP